jgi:membrane carboxypeptidase/penicillin-binding protein
MNKPPSRLRRFTDRHPRLVRSVLFATTFLVAFGGGAAFSSWSLVCRDGRCPPVQILDTYTPRQTSKVYAADGRFVAEVGLERRTLEIRGRSESLEVVVLRAGDRETVAA